MTWAVRDFGQATLQFEKIWCNIVPVNHTWLRIPCCPTPIVTPHRSWPQAHLTATQDVAATLDMAATQDVATTHDLAAPQDGSASQNLGCVAPHPTWHHTPHGQMPLGPHTPRGLTPLVSPQLSWPQPTQGPTQDPTRGPTPLG